VVVETHEERSHCDFHTHAIVEILGQFLLVVLWIGNEVSQYGNIHVIGQFVPVLFHLGIEVVDCNAERI
jgi:hypothetical protein